MAAQGAFRQNATVVTVYSTLGEEGVQHGVSQTRASIIVCDAKLLKVLLAVAPACPALRHVITIGEVPAALTARLPPGCIATTMDAVLALGRANPCAPSPPAPTDTAVIMYTSGTTGPPKGVVLNHANVCASMAGLVQAARFTAADVYLAYLPLAHIMELTSECVMFALGCAVGYGSPQTLTDSGLKLAPGCRGDAPTLRPTFMVFAPTVLDRVRQTVDARMAAAKPLKRRMAGLAMAAGFRDFARGRIGAPPLWNALVFKKVQALIGGRVKLMICGSAPLSAETQRFAQTAFNCPVRQGYGLTETCSAATVGAFDDNAWSVGRVLSSCKVKLLDWEEGNYRNADAADPAIRMPRGEILVGGPCVAQGYYNDPESPDPEIAAKNVSDFSVSADGTRYFHTGDIGQFTASGMLQARTRRRCLRVSVRIAAAYARVLRRVRRWAPGHADHRPQEGPGEAADGRIRCVYAAAQGWNETAHVGTQALRALTRLPRRRSGAEQGGERDEAVPAGGERAVLRAAQQESRRGTCGPQRARAAPHRRRRRRRCRHAARGAVRQRRRGGRSAGCGQGGSEGQAAGV